jgi:hypothetical protein
LIPFSLVCQQNLSQSDFGDRFLKIILVDKGGRQPGFGIIHDLMKLING